MELETQVLISERLRYINSETAIRILDSSAELGRILNGLMNSLK